jgi:hypothetical protein
MNRLLLIAAAAVAAPLIAAPTLVGLSGNTSFSRDIPVPVPSGAHHVRFVEPASSPAPSSPRTESRSGRDRRGDGPTDDHPRASVAPTRGIDDHGGRRSRGGDDTGPDDSGGRGGADDGGHGGGSDDSGSGRHGGRG